MAYAILERISGLELSSEIIAPSYLKLVCDAFIMEANFMPSCLLL